MRRNFTNINNNTYNTYNTYDYDNTNNNFTISDPTNAKKDLITPAGASGIASLSRPADSPLCPQGGCVGMPAIWRGVKFDLFNNGYRGQDQIPSLKIAISIIKQDRTIQYLTANLNSPPDYVFRNVEEQELDTAHWQVVKSLLREYKNLNLDFRVSKCVLKNKAGTTPLVLFLSELNNLYQICLVRNAEYYVYDIEKNLHITHAQKMKNIIASKFFGKPASPLIKLEDLGI